MDNGSTQPSRPATVSHRPWFRNFEHGDPPDHENDRPPPPYSRYANKLGPGGEKLQEVRNNKFIARRGGWWRLAAVAIVIAIIVVSLVVGLVVGLRNRRQRYVSSTGGIMI